MINAGTKDKSKRSYSDVTKDNKKENIMIVKPKTQQDSKETKKIIKAKVDIKNMNIRVTKFRTSNNGTVILGCDEGKDFKRLKETVKEKLEDNFKITESVPKKPKIRIINIGKEEFQMEDKDLLNTISKQNRIETDIEGFYMKLLKRIERGDGERENRTGRTLNNGGSIILELDENTLSIIMKERKVNVGWKKCIILEHFNVKRCYKCWGYYHIAKQCTREVTCHQCAGNHTADKCTEVKRRCVNCKHKIQKYNVKIDDEHDALSKECLTYRRALMKEKRRTGMNSME